MQQIADVIEDRDAVWTQPGWSLRGKLAMFSLVLNLNSILLTCIRSILDDLHSPQARPTTNERADRHTDQVCPPRSHQSETSESNNGDDPGWPTLWVSIWVTTEGDSDGQPWTLMDRIRSSASVHVKAKAP